jgi:putative ABC transport system permease protein
MLLKKMLRTVWQYKAQFISMIIMIAIGVGIFLGFNMEWVSLNIDTLSFLDETNFADYRIVSSAGFTKKDAEKIADIDGVESVSRYISVNADVDGTKNMLGLTVTENFDVSSFKVMKGFNYDEQSKNGIWLFDMYAKENDIDIGDKISLTYEKLNIKGEVKGLIESGEYMICVRDETQVMPDFETYGYAYISPVMLKSAILESAKKEARKNIDENIPKDIAKEMVEKISKDVADDTFKNIYPQINVISDLDKSEFTKNVENRLDKTLLVLTKDENISYVESQGEVEEGKTMGSILPVLFLLIAVLTMVTTMHRLAANEKTQIGTLKALGYKDRRILWHYTTFALTIGLIGSAIGIALGYLVARLVLNPDGMMGTYIVIPDWSIYIPWWCWAIMAGMVAFLTLIGFLSTREMLKGTAADALRPYTPKTMKRLAVEKLKVISKLNFGTKWNLRDILRHKSRSFMTLFGVTGCTLLIVAALGANDTMKGFIDLYYNDISNYSSRIFISENSDNTDAIKLAEKYDGDMSASISVQIDENPVSLDIYNIFYDTVRFVDEKNQIMKLPDDGAFVCMRIKKDYKLNIGDEITVSPYGTSDKYKIKILGFNRSITESISISKKYANSIKSNGKSIVDSDAYKINSIYTNTKKEDIKGSAVSSIQSKQDIINSMDSFMEIMYTMVIILIVAAVILGIIVLYNLGIMSYTERYREMATLKVVGFKDKQIGRLLISQNIWLSVIGILLGIPAGYGVLVGLMAMLASEYEMKSFVSVPSILLSFVLTLAVSLIVGLIIALKNRKIEMVAALKTGE